MNISDVFQYFLNDITITYPIKIFPKDNGNYERYSIYHKKIHQQKSDSLFRMNNLERYRTKQKVTVIYQDFI